MALTGVSITMETPFRDSVQEFSNVFFYQSLGVMGPGDASGIVSYLVNRMKPLHSGAVTFKRAKVWSAGGSTADNRMIHEEELTGTGTGSIVAEFDRERAFLIQWPAGFDVRGHPVNLKKWFHSAGNPVGAAAAASAQLANTAQISAAARLTIENLCAGFAEPDTLTEAFHLCSATGRLAEGPPVCHPYLEHHQLGDQWRG